MPNIQTTTTDEQARIESVWLAALWQFYDPASMVFASVGYYPRIEESPPGKPWELGIATTSAAILSLPEHSWYATCDEAKAVLAAAVLDLAQVRA